jgi:hypothetical protein
MPVSRKKLFIKEGGIIMFKAVPKAFWIGMGIVYAYTFVLIALEWNIPGFSQAKLLGIPACYIYCAIGGCWLLNVFIAWYFAYSEEQREAKLIK